jgi:pimeloyl-ACP methyl ester carboxylesterase
MMVLRPSKERVVTSFDGSLLAAQEFGGTPTGGSTARDGGIPLLVVPAIGATMASWRAVLVDVVRERRVASWDLRGLLGSSPPVTSRYDSGAHAEDGIAVADAFGVEDFHLASWSNGSRIALEIAARYPERVRSLTLVSGGYGHPMGRLRRLELSSLLPLGANVLKHFAGYLQLPLRSFVSRPEIAGIVRQSGFVGVDADIEALVELLQGIASCDLKTLMRIFDEVVGDSGRDLLPELTAPTLLVLGRRDPFTPPRMMEEMRDTIPDARLEIYERATHYLPIENPGRLSDDLRRFLKGSDGY